MKNTYTLGMVYKRRDASVKQGLFPAVIPNGRQEKPG